MSPTRAQLTISGYSIVCPAAPWLAGSHPSPATSPAPPVTSPAPAASFNSSRKTDLMDVLNSVTCPNCDAEDLRGARFCPHCGTGLGGNGAAPAVHAPLVRLLTEVAELQRELMRQLDKGRRTHARQFERAIAAQTESLQHTLDHHSRQSAQLQAWQKWTAALGAAVIVLVVIVVAVAG